jgi:hypothetical protein
MLSSFSHFGCLSMDPRIREDDGLRAMAVALAVVMAMKAHSN